MQRRQANTNMLLYMRSLAHRRTTIAQSLDTEYSDVHHQAVLLFVLNRLLDVTGNVGSHCNFINQRREQLTDSTVCTLLKSDSN